MKKLVFVVVILFGSSATAKPVKIQDFVKTFTTMGKLLGLPNNFLEDPPPEILEAFIAPSIRAMSKDKKLRRKYFEFIKKTLGEQEYKEFQYNITVENMSNLTPLKERFIRNQIFGRPKRFVFRRRR